MSDPNLNAVRFDPFDAFRQTLLDYNQVVELFRSSDAMNPTEFLDATRALGVRLKAISILSMNSLMSSVMHKIPDEVMAEYQARMDVESMMESPEDEMRKMIEAIEQIADFGDTDGQH